MKSVKLYKQAMFVFLIGIIATGKLSAVTDYKVGVEKDIAYLEPNRTEKLDLYYPADANKIERFPGIVFIHGGGWVGGDKAKKREQEIGTTLAKCGYVCVSINYILADKKPVWPQIVYDCKNAVRFLRKYADKYQIDPNNIGVIGGSAGGHLAAMLGVTGPEGLLEPNQPYLGISSRVGAVVDMYGISNLLTRQETDVNGVPTGKLKEGKAVKLLGAGRNENPKLWEAASPVTYITPDDPPVLILHGTADTTVDYKQSIEFAEKLSKAGVENRLHLIKGVGHTFSFERDVKDNPLPEDLRPLVVGFFDKYLKNN